MKTKEDYKKIIYTLCPFTFFMRYSELVEVYKRLEKTGKRLEKTKIISELIAKTPADDLPKITLLLEGKVFPGWDDTKIGFASKLIVKAINLASGMDLKAVEERWKKTGDLGTTAAELLSKKKQHTLSRTDLSVTKVFENIKKLALLQGEGSTDRKIQLVAELLTSATPEEATYIARTVLEDLRIGAGEGSIRDAIVWAFCAKELGLEYDDKENDLKLPDNSREAYKEYTEAVQQAYNITNDLGEVARTVKENGIKALADVGFVPGKPISAMLFQKAKDIKEAFETVGKPAAFEYKYDGFRVQIHKHGGKIKLFTRRLEDVTEQFPDIIECVKKHVDAESYILDSEAVGIKPKTNQYLPFQDISQRIRRKYDIKKMTEEFPVEVNVFDILFYNGKSMISKPFNERRAIISKIIDPVPRKIVPSRIIITDKEDEANKFYNESLDRGNEGMMAKNLNAIYKPGSRVGFGVKLKPVMESLDLVIVGAEWGEGKRARMLTSYTLACRDGHNFLEIGRVSTGLKELEEEGTSFGEMTELLKPLIIEEKGKETKVKPKIVIEVHYEEIQESQTYSSGFALRFPRFIRLRDDRAKEDIDTLETVKELYLNQRGRNKPAA
jgi:DNA ligase 1